MKETLKEAAKKYSGIAYNREDYEEKYYNSEGCCKYDAFIDGAKYQAEKSYSEKDMIEFAFNTYHYISELMGVPFRQVSENKLHVMYNLEQYKKR
jgi:hypothetical protein